MVIVLAVLLHLYAFCVRREARKIETIMAKRAYRQRRHSRRNSRRNSRKECNLEVMLKGVDNYKRKSLVSVDGGSSSGSEVEDDYDIEGGRGSIVSAYYEMSQPAENVNDNYDNEDDDGGSQGDEIDFVDYPDEDVEAEAELEEDAMRHEAALAEDLRFDEQQSDQDEAMNNLQTLYY